MWAPIRISTLGHDATYTAPKPDEMWLWLEKTEPVVFLGFRVHVCVCVFASKDHMDISVGLLVYLTPYTRG